MVLQRGGEALYALASWNYAQELESHELEVIQAGIAISWKLEAGAATESWMVKAGSWVM